MTTDTQADYTLTTERPAGLEDFNATLLNASLAFLRRHQGQHLGSDDMLFARGVRYLMSGFNVAQHAAEKLVSQAYDNLKNLSEDQHLVLDSCSEKTLVVADPDTGLTWAIPVALIYERIIYAQDDHRLHLVTP